MSAQDEIIEEGSGNVFADLGFADPDTHLLKAQLVTRVAEAMQERKLTQIAAAKARKQLEAARTSQSRQIEAACVGLREPIGQPACADRGRSSSQGSQNAKAPRSLTVANPDPTKFVIHRAPRVLSAPVKPSRTERCRKQPRRALLLTVWLLSDTTIVLLGARKGLCVVDC